MDNKRNKEPPKWAADLAASLRPLLTRDETAITLRCSRKTVDRRIREGLLKALRNGGRVVIPRAAVLAILGAE